MRLFNEILLLIFCYAQTKTERIFALFLGLFIILKRYFSKSIPVIVAIPEPVAPAAQRPLPCSL